MADIKVGMIFDVPKARASAQQAARAAQDAVNKDRGLTSKSTQQMAADWATRQAALRAQTDRWVAAARASRQQRDQAAAAAAQQQGWRQAAQTAVGRLGSRFGLTGAAGAAAGGAAGMAAAATLALTGAFILLRRAVREMTQAMEEARHRYARQLQSGLGGFTTQRMELARIIGVSENEVYQYGRAVAWLTGRMKLSVDTLNRTTTTIAASSYNWKLVGLNFRAYMAQLTAAMAPALNIVAKFISAWIEFWREAGIAEKMATVVARVVGLLTTAFALLLTPMMAVITAAVAMGNALEYFVRQIMNSYYRMTGQFSKVDNSDMFKETKVAFNAMMKMLGVGSRADALSKLPQATSSYRRLEASPWERMGLVIGSGQGGHPMKETATNTKRTVEALHKILNVLPRAGGVNVNPILPAGLAPTP